MGRVRTTKGCYMLSRQDFERHWQSLQDRFKVPAGKLSLLIFDAVKVLSERQWAQLVDNVIGDAKTIPTVTEFKRMTLSYVTSNEITYPCELCDGAGMQVKRIWKSFYDVAIRCTCLNGRKYPMIPTGISKEYAESVKALYGDKDRP